MSIVTKPGRIVTYIEELPSNKVTRHTTSHGPVRPREKLNKYDTSPLAHWPQPSNLLGWFVTYSEELPSIKSQDPLISWSCEITWQIKYVISLPPKVLWPLKLVSCYKGCTTCTTTRLVAVKPFIIIRSSSPGRIAYFLEIIRNFYWEKTFERQNSFTHHNISITHFFCVFFLPFHLNLSQQMLKC